MPDVANLGDVGSTPASKDVLAGEVVELQTLGESCVDGDNQTSSLGLSDCNNQGILCIWVISDALTFVGLLLSGRN